MYLTVESISRTAPRAIACELLLEAGLPPKAVKIVSIGRIAEALAL